MGPEYLAKLAYAAYDRSICDSIIAYKKPKPWNELTDCEKLVWINIVYAVQRELLVNGIWYHQSIPKTTKKRNYDNRPKGWEGFSNSGSGGHARQPQSAADQAFSTTDAPLLGSEDDLATEPLRNSPDIKINTSVDWTATFKEDY